jgi:hypothetical protein
MAKTKTVHTPEPQRLLKLTLRGARIAEVKRVDAESGSFKFHVQMGKDLPALCERMGWQEPGEKTTLENLEGKMLGGNLSLVCQDKLIDADVDMPYKSINAFALHRLELEGRKGKGFRRELRFNGTFDAPDGCALMESYMQRTANARGTLTITFMKEEVQENLPLTEAQQATLPEND